MNHFKFSPLPNNTHKDELNLQGIIIQAKIKPCFVGNGVNQNKVVYKTEDFINHCIYAFDNIDVAHMVTCISDLIWIFIYVQHN